MISGEILQKLSNFPLHVGENLVGLNGRAEKMNLLRFVRSTEVHMIGICGVGGIGKTTLAKAIYNRLYAYFEGHSYCEDVKGVQKQHGLVQVLQKLLYDFTRAGDIKIRSIGQGIIAVKRALVSKPVLMVLDNVDNASQLEALAGSYDWFHPGSLIIVTSKDKQLLNSCGMKEIFHIEYLEDNEALELFSLYAFKGKSPKEGFIELSDQVVQYVKGHPLALKVLGSFLYGKPVCEWESELNKLHRYPNAEIQQVLRLSFDGLDFNQQNIFLDIAFSFRGEKQSLATKVLGACDLFPETNMRVLIERSLISISSDSDMIVQMHDLIQRMGWQIVHEESRKPGERSRLSFQQEVLDVLNKNKVTEAVEVLVLALEKSNPKIHLHGGVFTQSNTFRILKIWDRYHKILMGIDHDMNYPRGLELIWNELRWLCWHGYPFMFLPSNFHAENLVALDLSYSLIKHVSKEPKKFEKLKLLKLRHCHYLTSIPDVTGSPNLEEINLEGCVQLVELHPSIGTLKKLIVLNMMDCKGLRSFPCCIELESLKILILSGCSKLEKLPEALGKTKTLVELWIDRTAILQIPSFLSSLSNLEVLSLARRKGIQSKWWSSLFRPLSLLSRMPQHQSLAFPFLPGLRMLRDLDISHCSLSEVSAESIGCLPHLVQLNLSGNRFTSLPDSLTQLSRLRTLGLIGSKNLEALPELPPSIQQFDAHDCTSLQKLPSIKHRGSYLTVDFTACPKLVENQTIESLFYMLQPQRCVDPSIQMDYVLPGSRIPQWFSNQSMGNSIKVELPKDWCYDNFVGYDTCAVLTPRDPTSCKNSYGQIGYDINNFDDSQIDYINVTLNSAFANETWMMSDVIWLSYRRSRSPWKKAKNHIKFSFRGSADVEVKQCGIRLICVEDRAAEGGSRMIQWLPPLAEDGGVIRSDDNDELENIEDGPPTKRSRFV